MCPSLPGGRTYCGRIFSAAATLKKKNAPRSAPARELLTGADALAGNTLDGSKPICGAAKSEPIQRLPNTVRGCHPRAKPMLALSMASIMRFSSLSNFLLAGLHAVPRLGSSLSDLRGRALGDRQDSQHHEKHQHWDTSDPRSAPDPCPLFSWRHAVQIRLYMHIPPGLNLPHPNCGRFSVRLNCSDFVCVWRFAQELGTAFREGLRFERGPVYLDIRKPAAKCSEFRPFLAAEALRQYVKSGFNFCGIMQPAAVARHLACANNSGQPCGVHPQPRPALSCLAAIRPTSERDN